MKACHHSFITFFSLLICFLLNLSPSLQEVERRQVQRGSRFLLQRGHQIATVNITEVCVSFAIRHSSCVMKQAPENGRSLNESSFTVRFEVVLEVQKITTQCRLEYQDVAYREWHPCTSPYRVVMPDEDGRYTLRLMAVPESGFGQYSEEVTRSWVLDRSPPTTTLLKPLPDNTTRNPEFSFSGSDDRGAVHRFTCKLDDDDWTSCTPPHTITVHPAHSPTSSNQAMASAQDLECGSHIFAVKAVDAAGNIDPDGAKHLWKISPIETKTELLSSFESSPAGLSSERREPSEGSDLNDDSPTDDDILRRTRAHLLLSLLIVIFALIGVFFICLWIHRCCNCIKRRSTDLRRDGGGSHLTSLESDIWTAFDRSGFSTLMASSWPEDLRRFRYIDLWAATRGFPEEGILGEGGFGKVYAGTLEDGRSVAVKKLEKNGLQGDKEFFVEVATLCRARHRNVLHLFGVCIENGNRVCVFELMDWGSARSLLDECDTRFTWNARLKAAVGAARGLACLHESVDPPIVHRDLKSENILMDRRGEAHISDFGLCTLSHQEAKQRHLRRNATLTVGTIRGTFGYLAPEVIRYGRVSTKSDVYAFGVFLLELLTGRRPIETVRPSHEQDLVKWILGSIDKPDDIMKTVDPLISSDVSVVKITAFVELAASCLSENPSGRPTALNAARRLEEVMIFEEGTHQETSMKGKSKKGSKGKIVELCLVPRLSETSGTIPTGMPFPSCMSEGEATPHAATTPIASTSSGRIADMEFLSRRVQESSLEQQQQQQQQQLSPHGIFSPTYRDHHHHGIDPGPSAAVDSSNSSQ